jgi:hypothetical protein
MGKKQGMKWPIPSGGQNGYDRLREENTQLKREVAQLLLINELLNLRMLLYNAITRIASDTRHAETMTGEKQTQYLKVCFSPDAFKGASWQTFLYAVTDDIQTVMHEYIHIRHYETYPDFDTLARMAQNARKMAEGLDKLYAEKDSDGGAYLLEICRDTRTTQAVEEVEQFRAITKQKKGGRKEDEAVTIAVDLALSLEAKYTNPKNERIEWEKMIPEMISTLKAIAVPNEAQSKALEILINDPDPAEWVRSNVKSRKRK